MADVKLPDINEHSRSNMGLEIEIEEE